MREKILIADDEESSRTGMESLLSKWGYEVEVAQNGRDALEKTQIFRPDVVITDLVMPEMDGLELLQAFQSEQVLTPLIILTGHGTIETAVTAIKQGAYDYLTKPLDVARLKIMVEKALEKGKTLREITLLQKRLKNVWGLGKLVGKSKAMQEVYSLIELAAPTPARVLILGESGTGKELVAQSLHELSLRSKGPFVPINCSAIPDTLLESEIFGHEKGAFTGALDRKLGCFELANGGTIFLDEVAEMSSAIQAKFLRILEDSTLKRLGGSTPLKIDVRVFAATNKNPTEAIADGILREDLYYRLNVCTIVLPPLRERQDDIPLLIQAFIEEFNSKYERKIKSVNDDVLQMMLTYSWPGNVRELRNVIERAVLTSTDTDLIIPKNLPPLINNPTSSNPADSIRFPLGTTVAEAERQLILKTLAGVENNKTRAAEVLGISLKTLHNKLHQYGVHDAPEC